MAVDPGMPAGQRQGLRGGPDSEFDTPATVDDISNLTVAAMVASDFGGPAVADNGARFLEFSGGTYVVDTLTVTGGTLAANGTAAMAVAPGETSTQPSLAVTFGGTATGTSIGWLVLDGTATEATTIGTVAAA